MTQSELTAPLQRQQHTRKNLKRYMHTRSFNQLAGRNTAPGSARRTRRSHASAKIMLSLIAMGSIATGLYFVFF